MLLHAKGRAHAREQKRRGWVGGRKNSTVTVSGKLVVEDEGWRKRRQAAEGKGSEGVGMEERKVYAEV